MIHLPETFSAWRLGPSAFMVIARRHDGTAIDGFHINLSNGRISVVGEGAVNLYSGKKYPFNWKDLHPVIRSYIRSLSEAPREKREVMAVALCKIPDSVLREILKLC